MDFLRNYPVNINISLWKEKEIWEGKLIKEIVNYEL
tara:strand:+ start:172 stop:279 length:108 start_codon:yes stop_codon:yes gene_type:complete